MELISNIFVYLDQKHEKYNVKFILVKPKYDYLHMGIRSK